MRRILSLLAPLLALLAIAAPAHAKDTINYGDNTSSFANNGECDDPRFDGQGMASILTASDRGHDAEDCAAGVKAGKVRFMPLPAYEGEGKAPKIGEIDFGDDSSQFAHNGDCDDRRFGGRTMASILIDSDIRHDAADCRTGMEQGDLAFVKDMAATVSSSASSESRFGGGAVDLSGIDFGDNTSTFALNGECDDPRFEGEAMDSALLASDIRHDASDCALAMIDGKATLKQPNTRPRLPSGDIDYGDDSSTYANNDECDDPRFSGEGMAIILIDEDAGHDATDCMTLVADGSIEYIGD
jgi:hypothetical protein